MKQIVGSNQELCVGCNRCIRACPIEMANLTYEDGEGNIKTKVDDSKCIACGACVSACKHGARFYQDDLAALLAALAAGEKVSLLAAPSLKTNFPQWKRLLAWLRRQGVEKIYDVSLGADICIWAHLRHLEATEGLPMITQPCPAVVSYCEIYRPELLGRLSPVHSPMGCTAVYMREYAGVTGTLAALSPCFAKGQEFESTGLVQYNVVFARLQEHLVKNHVELPEEEGGFDHPPSGLGAIFPMPGGLRENIEFFTGGALRVDRAEGPAVYPLLDAYAGVPDGQLPVVFDVLNCEQGCNIGPGALRDRGFFEINTEMERHRHAALEQRSGHYEKLYAEYDKRLDPALFTRVYTARPSPVRAVGEADIQRAFELLDKHTYAQQNHNCGACGCETCRDMARRIALGINIPLNCIVKSRDDTAREHQRNTAYVGLVHNVAGHLLNTGEEEHSRVVLGAMESLCAAMRGSHVSLWKTAEEDGELLIHRLYDWPDDGSHAADVIYEHQLPDWTANMRAGIPLYLNREAATKRDKVLFSDPAVVAFQLVPLMIKGKYWGLFSVRFTEAHPMSAEEVSVISSIGLLLVSSIMDNEMNRRLIEAREEALAGTRAKSDFLSRMSHEMRTPMNAIIGMTKIAGTTDDVSRLRHCLSTIGASSAHLLGLINDVLDMSKIEAGKFELDIAPFDLEQTIIKICSILAEKAEEKHQQLHVEMDPALPTGYAGDELRLSQVITNLLGNAVKFTPEGGTICLSVEVVGCRDSLCLLHISVEDTGIGMTDEQVSRLFTAFEQADSSIAGRFGGTGLGLAISKTIVEKMNGSIWAESEPGQGATFCFEVEMRRAELPADEAPAPEGLNLVALASGADGCRRVQTVAASLGYSCDTTSSPGQLLRLCEGAKQAGQPYNLALVDFRVDGIADRNELAARLNTELGPGRIVAIGSFAQWSQDASETDRLGITLFLPKPVFPATLRQVARQAAGMAPVPAGPATGLPDFSGVRLLLVEDIEINREVFTALLEGTGLQVDTAENGLQAVEKFEADPNAYDIVVMDIQMPEMDGYEATRRIRAMPAGRAQTVPIIAMTANAFKEDIERCLECGMNGHLTKPIDDAAVMEMIAAHTAN